MKMASDGNTFTYRQAGIEDIDALKQLGIAAYGQFANVLEPEHWATLNGFLQDGDRLAELIKKSAVFICLHENVIVGKAYLVPSGNPWDIFEADWSYLRSVGVHPDYEGKGIAKALMKRCLDHAKKSGERVLALHTSEFMDAARHIYETMGFKQIRELAPRLGKRYWLYLLELND